MKKAAVRMLVILICVIVVVHIGGWALKMSVPMYFWAYVIIILGIIAFVPMDKIFKKRQEEQKEKEEEEKQAGEDAKKSS